MSGRLVLPLLTLFLLLFSCPFFLSTLSLIPAEHRVSKPQVGKERCEKEEGNYVESLQIPIIRCLVSFFSCCFCRFWSLFHMSCHLCTRVSILVHWFSIDHTPYPNSIRCFLGLASRPSKGVISS